MPQTVQEYLAGAAQKAAADLSKAYLNIPDEKRDWSPSEHARTALDMYAECVLLNSYTADTITNQAMTGSMESFLQDKAEVKALPWEQMHAQFEASVAKIMAAIGGVVEADMDVVIAMPWGPMTPAQLITYPHWNMTYHEGQINYIASILGCLP